MKKAVLSTVLLSSLLLGGTIVNAEGEKDPNNDSNRKSSTDVDIKLKDSSDIHEEKGPFSDTLALVYTPSAYSFSGDLVDVSNRELKLENETKKAETQNIVVNDDRKDKETGMGKDYPWTLSAAFEVNKEQTGLQGAVLELIPNGAYTYDIGGKHIQTKHGDDIEPKPAPNEITGEVASGITTEKNVKLNANAAAQPIMTSTKDAAREDDSSEKRGAFTNLNNAKLHISSNSTKGSYSGKVLWTLQSDYKG